jgi:ATPase family associated with various cellular activities (AAA)
MADNWDLDRFGSLFQGFLDSVVSNAPVRESEFRTLLRQHFGTDPVKLPVVGIAMQTAEHANLQVALDAFAAKLERDIEVLGVGGQHKRYMGLAMADLLAGDRGPGLSVGPVEYAQLPSGPNDTISCIQWGLLLIAHATKPLAVLVRGAPEHGPRSELYVEAMGVDRDQASSFLSELRRLMREHNLYRGRVVSVGRSFGEGPFPKLGVTFHELAPLQRDEVVLPEGLLERIERHTIGFARHADRLTAAGRHLRRGLLLYGPPGTGKTHTVTYLAGQMPERTVLLLTGADQALVSASFELARELTPAMVVLEDVDLIAEERTIPQLPARLPLLFTLLNELDGLASDADVITVLTTNRADLIEPALAARPGRIDLAVELPLPDATSRQRLIDLYGRGLALALEDPATLLERTEGVSPAFIKELLRAAALRSAEDQHEPLVVRDQHLHAALDDLTTEASGLTATLLGAGTSDDTSQRPAIARLPGNIPTEVLQQLTGRTESASQDD